MPLKYFECVFTDTGDYMLVPDDKMGEVVKAMEVMCSQGFPPNMAKDRILEIFFPKGQAEENSEVAAKVEEVFKSVTHLHEVNEDSSDESSSSNGLPQREMSILHDLSLKSKRKQYPSFKEPDICTIPVGTRKDAKKEATPEAVDEKLLSATTTPKQRNAAEPKECIKSDNATRKLSDFEECKITKTPATAAPKLAPKECQRNENVIRKPSNAGECKITKDIKYNEQPSAKEGILSNGPVLLIEQLKPEEITHKPKLDEIFPNLVEGSNIDIFSEAACARLVTEKKDFIEERVKTTSPVPVKKAKMDMSEPTCKAPPKPIAQPANTPITEPEVKKPSIPPQEPRPNSAKDLGDKNTPKKPKTPVTERKEAKTDNKTSIAACSVTVKKEEKVINEDSKAKKPDSSSCCRKQEDACGQERKVSKQRPTSVAKSPAAVRHKEPPKESMMAGGECFASVGGIEQEAANSVSVAAATPRRTSNVTQQSTSRETTVTRTAISKQLNKLRNNKNWKKKHMVIAGGIGIAMVCCYAYYKTKT